MAKPLWDWHELAAAAEGYADGEPSAAITGVSIDSRSLAPGDLFVALRDKRDGHEFVTQAFRAGAAAALVARDYRRREGDGALVRTADTLRGLQGLARAARARTSARVAAVTGSVGKTGTKEALRRCLAVHGPAHASEKSYNNHWGVPLTLARMPAETRYGVFEIGMNRPGEITPLSLLVQPHVAVITAVEPVHLGYFRSVTDIAEAKAEIFRGLEPGGTAVINRDSPYFSVLLRRATEAAAKIVTFGSHPDADVRLERMELGPDGSSVEVRMGNSRLSYRVGAPGEHHVTNSLAIVATLAALGVDLALCLPVLRTLSAAPGRGERSRLLGLDGPILLIDESYNANPASMRAALAAMATTPREVFPRRIAVLGDMLELGDAAPALHRELREAIDAAGIDLVLACGPMMKELIAVLPPSRRGAWADTSAGLIEALLDTVKAGDVVMIKGSLGSRMAPLVDTLKARWAHDRQEGAGGMQRSAETKDAV
jgi:UDP-N-acetylmuramoyl-tripeptide--D-alanyl-D-alanine ligase